MYTSYSQRNNITDTDLSGLLDYIEREICWDIENGECVICRSKRISIHKEWSDIMIWYNNPDLYQHSDLLWNEVILKIRKDIFYKTYKTLLPEIRNLYSK